MSANALREIKRICQRDAEAKRRWFTSPLMEVFLWENVAGCVVGFDLTYDKPHAEKAISWRLSERMRSSRVLLDGQNAGGHPGTPLLIANAPVDGWFVCGLLMRFCGELDSDARTVLCTVSTNRQCVRQHRCLSASLKAFLRLKLARQYSPKHGRSVAPHQCVSRWLYPCLRLAVLTRYRSARIDRLHGPRWQSNASR